MSDLTTSPEPLGNLSREAMSPEAIASLVEDLTTGIASDIWYDAAEHDDHDGEALIERTQRAMQHASDLLPVLREMTASMSIALASMIANAREHGIAVADEIQNLQSLVGDVIDIEPNGMTPGP